MDSFNDREVTKQDVSQTIRALYEAYPYPSRIPGGSADPFLELIWSFNGKPHEEERSFLDAGCGTGLNVLGGAAIYPSFQIFGCDLNRVALEQLKKEAAEIGLSNLTLQEMDLLHLDPDFGPSEGFDIIYSTGVIHHTADPVGILKSMAKRLAPQGVLRLMVYGEKGRSDLYRFARVARSVYGKDEYSWAERVKRSKKLLHWVGESAARRGAPPPPVFRGPWEDAKRIDDVEFADRYLNPHDQPFTIRGLKEALDQAGLKFLRWFEPREWDLTTLLPGFQDYAPLPEDQWDRFELVEGLFDRPKFDLYLVHPDFVGREVAVTADTYIGLNPQLFLNCVKARGVSFHRAAQLRLWKESVLTRDEGQLLESIALRFITVESLIKEMPNPSLEHWLPLVQSLVEREYLFCPHP